MFFSKKVATVCAVSCLMAIPVSAFSEEVTAAPGIVMAKKWLFNFTYENVSINQDVADDEFIDSSAGAFNLDGEYFFNDEISSALGIGFIRYDDNNSFKQATESVYGGDRETSSSSATGIPLYVDVGYTRFSDTALPIYMTVRGGYAFMLASERSIGSCTDCHSEDIDVNTGAFGLVGFGVNLHRYFSLGLYYKNYLSGDVEDAVGLKLSFGNFRPV